MSLRSLMSPDAQYGCAVACLGGAIQGYILCVVNGAVAPLAERFSLDTAQRGLVVSMVVLGALGGSLFGGTLCDACGRRAGIFTAATLFALGSLLQGFALGIHGVLAGRLFAGMGIGVIGVAGPIYLCEMAPTEFRGTLVTANEILVCLGCLAGLAANLALLGVAHDWRWMLGASAVPALGMTWLSCYMPETSVWLAQQSALLQLAASDPAAETADPTLMPTTPDATLLEKPMPPLGRLPSAVPSLPDLRPALRPALPPSLTISSFDELRKTLARRDDALRAASISIMPCQSLEHLALEIVQSPSVPSLLMLPQQRIARDELRYRLLPDAPGRSGAEAAPAPGAAPAEGAAAAKAGAAARVSLLTALRSPELRRPMLLAVTVMLANNAMYAGAVQGFVTEILAGAGVGNPPAVALGVGLTKLCGVVVCVALVDRTGRRPLLLVGAAGMCGCHALVAVGFALAWPNLVGAALVSVFFFWNMSWSGLIWTVSAELLPDAVRAPAMGMAIVVFWVTSFVSTQTLETLLEALSPEGAFALFAAGCVVAGTFVLCVLPETKGSLHAAAAATADRGAGDGAGGGGGGGGGRAPAVPTAESLERLRAATSLVTTPPRRPSEGALAPECSRKSSTTSIDSDVADWEELTGSMRQASTDAESPLRGARVAHRLELH